LGGKLAFRATLSALVGIAVAVALLVLWTSTRTPAPVAAPAGPEAPPHVETRPCWFTIPPGRAAQCGAVVEGPAEAGLPVEIRFVVVRAEAAVAADPVVYINGGPGSAIGIDAAGIVRWWELTRSTPWMAGRDVVLFDQRGVGLSTPSLDCPELSEAGGRIFVDRLAPADQAALWRHAAERCRERLIAGGIRPEAFNTSATVNDLAVLLDGLGYRRWNLYGVSYGTRVALEFLRTADARTRSVILDSVYPPDVLAYAEAGSNAAAAFDLMVRRCLDDARCAAETPHLGTLLERDLQAAATTGYSVPVALPGSPVQLAAIDQAKLVDSLFYGFYRWDTIQHMPQILAALGRGDTGPLAPLAGEAFATAASPQAGYGAFLAVECHDEYPFEDSATIEARAAALGAFQAFMLTNLPVIVCPVWPVGRADPATRQSVRSAVPVLLLSGELDPITPPAWARHAAETLGHGVAFVFPGVGHGVVAAHACAARLAAKFLADPDAKPFDECLLALGRAG
jgi:pimeloyl-ACP methyl ester carboxylesterase